MQSQNSAKSSMLKIRFFPLPRSLQPRSPSKQIFAIMDGIAHCPYCDVELETIHIAIRPQDIIARTMCHVCGRIVTIEADGMRTERFTVTLHVVNVRGEESGE